MTFFKIAVGFLPILLALSLRAGNAPSADHHMHVLSLRGSALLGPGTPSVSARDVIKVLDEGHLQKGTIISAAYRFGAPFVHIKDEATEVDRENAWTAAQAQENPKRLFAFCSVNPLKAYASEAIDHCASLGMRGLKLHLANAGFRFEDPGQIAALQTIFSQANRLHMSILIHLRNAFVWNGVHSVDVFMDEVVSKAPDVTIQIAHLGGWGGYDRSGDEALITFVSHCQQQPSACRHLYFDVAAIFLSVKEDQSREALRKTLEAVEAFPQGPERMAQNLRKLGLAHLLFATDFPMTTPEAYTSTLREKLRLTAKEIDQIFSNVAPYFGGIY